MQLYHDFEKNMTASYFSFVAHIELTTYMCDTVNRLRLACRMCFLDTSLVKYILKLMCRYSE